MKYQDGMYREPFGSIIFDGILNLGIPLIPLIISLISILIFYIVAFPFMMNYLETAVNINGMDPSVVLTFRSTIQMLPIIIIIFIVVTVLYSISRMMMHIRY